MLNFFAPINSLGYGVFAHGLMRAYDQYISKEIALFPTPSTEVMDETIQRWLENGKKFRRNDPSIMIFQAPWLNRFSGKPAMGFPIFELDQFDEYEANILSQLDVVLQPSHWGKKVVENHGVKNVHVVTGGYDPKVFSPEMSFEEKCKRIEKQGISFVHVGKFEPRKSSEEILHCFVRACEGQKIRSNFLFHVYNPFDVEWMNKIKKILEGYGYVQSGQHFARENVRIVIPQERFKGDPSKLYQMAEFGIWASKAEGWNLPLLECLATGRPCLTTDNTAQSEFVRKGIYPEELILSTNQKEPTRPGGGWWLLDHEELIRKIQAIFKEPERFLKMESACVESAGKFTWEHSARQLENVMQQVVGN